MILKRRLSAFASAAVDDSRQRGLRIVHEDPEVRRGAAQRISGLGRGSCLHRGVPRKGLQPETAALRARLLAARRVRSPAPQGGRFAAAFFMSFLRHLQIYPPIGSLVGTGDGPLSGFAPGPHRLDESATGYSSAGCAPAEPASASPGDYEYELQSYRRSKSFHPTANSVLTVCVTPGGRRNPKIASTPFKLLLILSITLSSILFAFSVGRIRYSLTA